MKPTRWMTSYPTGWVIEANIPYRVEKWAIIALTIGQVMLQPLFDSLRATLMELDDNLAELPDFPEYDPFTDPSVDIDEEVEQGE